MAEISDFASDRTQIAENYRIWKAIQNTEFTLYFDTADIIDMLHGIASMSAAPGMPFKWSLYNEPKQLVYAVAYKKWLGGIRLLSPHLAELYDKLRSDRFQRHKIRMDISSLNKTFWGKEDILSKEVVSFVNGKYLGKKENSSAHINMEALLASAPHIFQGTYLMANHGDWRSRYRFLKEQGIIDFDQDIVRVNELVNDEVFKKLHKALNNQRPLTANNYVDALALCLFDQKLRKAEKNNAPPLFFFADQDHLLKAVEEVSREKLNGRFPFRFQDAEKKLDFLTVRTAPFFFLLGILHGVKSEYEDLWNRFEYYLEEITKESQEVRRYTPSSEAAAFRLFILEFFASWWHKEGMKDLKLLFNTRKLASENYLEREVQSFINSEFEHLSQRINLNPKVLEIIRESLDNLSDIKQTLKTLYPNITEINAANEFGNRFSFKPEAYRSIQKAFSELQSSARAHSSEEVEDIKETIINNISSAFTKVNLEREEDLNDILNKLASAVGILWLLKKYYLVERICDTITNIPYLCKDKNEKYPSPPFAILHVVVLLADSEPDMTRVTRILQCVRSKYDKGQPKQNYKVWLSLSFAYFMMAGRIYKDIAVIPEDLSAKAERSMIREQALICLRNSKKYSRYAFEYLSQKELESNDINAMPRRYRFKHYAINNLIFCETLLTERSDFETTLSKLVNMQESIVEDEHLWHRTRYADTIARYYYRKARISDNPDDLTLKKMYRYNNRSLKEQGINEKKYPFQLKIQIEHHFGVWNEV
ncbi:hypothetical protein [Phaeodactylibacter xiamenensis]|uniref:hypothetical protein n=1 Tax=Phaeodactylibacter xiamenensis TaxID=1524460 RepID=UPI0024A803DF|nr:hypothetical protein [Phaeodactylibacter xiamenensis]